jgi:GcrA cell cycle regulator
MTMTWTPERVDQLHAHITAGMTCSQIADEIGVSRNAVIGKIHRLGLSGARPAGQPARKHREPGSPRTRLSQRRLLRAAFAPSARGPYVSEVAFAPVDSPQRCSLLALTQGSCRWPLNDPATADFAFCGNDAIAGFSYCTGHARMAYRGCARR